MRPLLVAAAGIVCALGILFGHSTIALSGGWERAKNVADDLIYDGVDRTFYCGCVFTSDEDSDGSGDVDHEVCGYEGPESHEAVADRVQWEHVVPASLMPARQMDCWVNGGREMCEDEDPVAQAMLFDLHNLAPSIGQVNQLRGNDRYADLPEETNEFGECMIEDTANAFEPPDCLKGDVARIWLYMGLRHGVAMADEEVEMFEDWSAGDPVSPWESDREKRIARYTFVINPFVRDATPDPVGACSWE